MKVKFFCPRWGAETIPWDQFLKKVKDAGFCGIEWFPADASQQEIKQVLKLLEASELVYSIVMTVTPQEPDFDKYLQLLKNHLLHYGQMGQTLLQPSFISVQMGREYFTGDQIDLCLDICAKVQQNTGIPIYQETHRNKWSYAAHVIPPVLKRHQTVSLTLDVSHWFCVSESYLEDQQEAVALAISHTRHLHARVGHTQGSQVPDFEWPAYKDAFQAHLAIWDRWVNLIRQSGAEYCTITPEFGPPPYLIQTEDHGSDADNNQRSAIDEQWDLNVRMMQFLDQRYNL